MCPVPQGEEVQEGVPAPVAEVVHHEIVDPDSCGSQGEPLPVDSEAHPLPVCSVLQGACPEASRYSPSFLALVLGLRLSVQTRRPAPSGTPD